MERGDPSSRRRFLRSVAGLAAGTGLPGCGRVDHYEFRAAPVVLPPTERRALGYEEVRRNAFVTEHAGTIRGVEVAVTVESRVAVYEPRAPTGPATVGVTSTPPAVVDGRSLNPLASAPLAGLLTTGAGTRLLARLEVDEVGHDRAHLQWARGPTVVATRAGTCLGRETSLETHAGVLDGSPPSVVYVHVTRVAADSVVVPAAVHGRDVTDPDRPLVGAEGYATRAAVAAGLDALAATGTALAYAADVGGQDG